MLATFHQATEEEPMSDEQRFDVSQFGAEIKRLLVFAAHPDDLETTSGGTLALLIDRGIEVALLLGTDGDIGTHDLSFTRETLAGFGRPVTAREVAAAFRGAGEARIGEWLATQVAPGQARGAEDGRFVGD